MRAVLLLLAATRLAAAFDASQQRKVDEILGVKGAYTGAEDVYRVSFPRTDVQVTADQWPMHPFMGLTSWVAFTSGSGGEAMVMGDLALFEDEVNPAMSAALDRGLAVTALHNHFFYDVPRVMFMHIAGHGSVEQLASAVRMAMDKVREIRRAAPAPAARFPGPAIPGKSAITAAAIEGILGVRGQSFEGMYKVSIGRPARMHGREVGNQMGVNTWAAFAGTDDNALVDGDFALLESELQGVLKALRRAGINIVAIHNHLTDEEPRYVFLHYWGKGRAAALARGLKAALDAQKGGR
jgi:hypothetical protein